MNTDLSERVVLVTGGSSGIGRATVRRFGVEGARVAVTYHSNEQAANETAADITDAGVEAMTVPYGLLDDASIEAAVEEVVSAWDGVDVLVNNAVVWDDTAPEEAPSFDDLPPREWRRELRGNLEDVFLTTQQVVAHMKAQQWGRIVNISSNIAEDDLPGASPYAAAQSWLLGMTRNLAVELGSEDVLTNAVLPGLTLTERNRESMPSAVREGVAGETPTGRLTTLDDVADLVVFLASGRNGHVNGEAIRITGGL